jgi:hypothetical protein
MRFILLFLSFSLSVNALAAMKACNDVKRAKSACHGIVGVGIRVCGKSQSTGNISAKTLNEALGSVGKAPRFEKLIKSYRTQKKVAKSEIAKQRICVQSTTRLMNDCKALRPTVPEKSKKRLISQDMKALRQIRNFCRHKEKIALAAAAAGGGNTGGQSSSSSSAGPKFNPNDELVHDSDMERGLGVGGGVDGMEDDIDDEEVESSTSDTLSRQGAGEGVFPSGDASRGLSNVGSSESGSGAGGLGQAAGSYLPGSGDMGSGGAYESNSNTSGDSVTEVQNPGYMFWGTPKKKTSDRPYELKN